MLLKQLKELIPEYEEFSRGKGLSIDSIEMRVLYIKKFIEYMEKIYVNPPKNIEYINNEHVFSFLEWKRKHVGSIYSLDNYFKNIKYFFDFMYDEKNMKNPVLRNIPGPIVDRDKHDRQYDYFTEEEMKMIIATAEREKEINQDFISFRNYTIILLISYAALSLKELRNLKDYNIDFDNKLITIKNKNGRTFYLNSKIYKVLNSYLKYKNKKYNSDYVFPSRQSTQISSRAVQNLVRSIVIKSGIKEKGRDLSPNTLRHSVIKIMVENKWELPVISNICGLKQKSLHKYIDLYTPNAELKEVIYLDDHPFVR